MAAKCVYLREVNVKMSMLYHVSSAAAVTGMWYAQDCQAVSVCIK